MPRPAFRLGAISPLSGFALEVPLPAPRSTPEPQRIAKLLARAGIASRREVERMIEEGRIAIDGETVSTPATLIPSLRGVTVDGNPVKAPAPARLFLYHKPAGVLTAERDPAGRPTIYDRMPAGLPRLMPVGRLDLNTEGLLLLTTDGGLKRQLELPSSGVERVYRARAFGDVSQEQLEALIQGVEIEGVRYGPIDANLERRTGRNQWIEVRITEGKNREVRRVLEHLGLKVSRLIRLAYGPFELGDLPAGEVHEIRQHDLILFRNDLTAARPSALSARNERAAAPAARPRAPAGEPSGAPHARPPRPEGAPRPPRSPSPAPRRGAVSAARDDAPRPGRGLGQARPRGEEREAGRRAGRAPARRQDRPEGRGEGAADPRGSRSSRRRDEQPADRANRPEPFRGRGSGRRTEEAGERPKRTETPGGRVAGRPPRSGDAPRPPRDGDRPRGRGPAGAGSAPAPRGPRGGGPKRPRPPRGR